MNRVRSRRTIARKSPAIWTIVAFVVCERIRRSRVNAVNFYWLHKLYITCYSLPHLNDDLDSCNSQQFPDEFAWFRTSNGSTRKSHLRQVLTHIVFPSQNKLDVPKLTLKSFENQPLCKRVRGRWWGFSLLLFYNFDELRQQKVTWCFQPRSQGSLSCLEEEPWLLLVTWKNVSQ